MGQVGVYLAHDVASRAALSLPECACQVLFCSRCIADRTSRALFDLRAPVWLGDEALSNTGLYAASLGQAMAHAAKFVAGPGTAVDIFVPALEATAVAGG